MSAKILPFLLPLKESSLSGLILPVCLILFLFFQGYCSDYKPKAFLFFKCHSDFSLIFRANVILRGPGVASSWVCNGFAELLSLTLTQNDSFCFMRDSYFFLFVYY